MSARRFRPDWAAVPVVAFLGVFFALPIAAALLAGFLKYDPIILVGREFTLANYVRFLTDWFYLRVFVDTLVIAVLVTAASVVIAYPVALHLHQVASSRTRTFLILIILLPVMVSYVVTAFAWVVILGRNGFVNQALMATGLLAQPLALLSRPSGVVVVLIYTFAPFMVMNIYAALEAIDRSLLRAAAVLGAPPRAAFWSIIVPMSLPGVLSGTLLVFALSLGAFVTPMIIGGNQVKTVPVMIYNFVSGVFDWPGAGAMAGLLLVLSYACNYIISRLFHRRLAWLKNQR
ncbi:ABC transporter permease [Xanthobacter pseudotagetidis]|uniref:ABC transporter permease n=1 Tax=Xanthobacter pseudotagetidis TaxID=3119911 RepID=UPI0037276CDC